MANNIMELNIEQPIIYKTEKIDKRRAQWVIDNFDKISFRSQIDDEEKKQIKIYPLIIAIKLSNQMMDL